MRARTLFSRKSSETAWPDTIDVVAGEASIQVKIKRNPRAKRYLLRLPVGASTPVVTVPKGGTLARACGFVQSHSDWLAERLAKRPQARAFMVGGLAPLRGVEHRIALSGKLRGLVEAREATDGVREIVVPGDEAHLARKLEKWLKQQALFDLEAAVARHARALGKAPTGISVRDTRSRWGSCASNGRLSFSWRLVLAPPDILDYVAAHEVAHLAQMNHGPQFWTLCRQLAPQTDLAREWLRTHGAHLHCYG